MQFKNHHFWYYVRSRWCIRPKKVRFHTAWFSALQQKTLSKTAFSFMRTKPSLGNMHSCAWRCWISMILPLKWNTSWWFQPIWKKHHDSRIGSSPQVRVKIKNPWYHHLESTCRSAVKNHHIFTYTLYAGLIAFIFHGPTGSKGMAKTKYKQRLCQEYHRD